MFQCPKSGKFHFYAYQLSGTYIKSLFQCPKSGKFHFYEIEERRFVSDLVFQCPKSGKFHFYIYDLEGEKLHNFVSMP